MSLLHFRCKERRRTVRVALNVPLTIQGKSDTGTRFMVQSHSLSINRHGALFPLEMTVVIGQTLLLMNDHTAKSAECRVVAIHRDRDGRQYIGVEFVAGESNFWHMQFPIPGERPLRRTATTKVTA